MIPIGRERENMSRRREPDRSTLPPPESQQAELAQGKAFDDRLKTGPPAEDYLIGPDGAAHPDKKPGDTKPANGASW